MCKSPPIRTDRAGLGIIISLSTFCIVWGMVQLLLNYYWKSHPFIKKDAVVVAYVGLITRHLVGQITKQPRNNPYEFMKRKLPAMQPKVDQLVSENNSIKPRLVCLGDSLTHAHCSSSWVDVVSSQLSSEIHVVNAGQNSITSWTIAEEVRK